MNVIIVGSGWGANAARTLRRDPRVTLRAVIGRGSPRTIALAEELAVPPAGAVVRVVTDRGGAATTTRLVEPSRDPDPAAGYREAIGRLVTNFVDAIAGEAELIAPLDCEIDVRAAWAAIGKSLRSG